MPDKKQAESSNSGNTPSIQENGSSTPSPSPQISSQRPPSSLDRGELLSRARTFLQSPQIIHQDISEKRRFLVEKGLHAPEIDDLLRELPPQRPLIPPRTYPQPPPSNLPTLFLGLIRLFSWLTGGSAALIFLYYRFLLPRITRTSQARHSIKSHHLSLLRKLSTSIASMKESQSESYSVLPRPEPFKEPDTFAACNSVPEVLKTLGEKNPAVQSVPPITLIRCGIADCGKGKAHDLANPTTEELFRYLEGQIPWLISEEGLSHEQKLWEMLSTCPLFTGVASVPTPNASSQEFDDQKPTRWTYNAPTPVEPSPILKSITALSTSMPKGSSTKQSSFQYTLQSLADFTGYISTQVYLPYRHSSNTAAYMPINSNPLNPAEDEFKREVRALKGLVLNRRSFMPPTARPSVPSNPVRTP
ncbi:hypothetical protein Hypma_012766 [Hypsizygus marmoreus]|uniref:Peroxisome membrane anchor protein Pex14p N-terminal domain-containing protein n=1 Tax=Hypsizygus marmoreus TaxID=39966 RepID=A0A369JE19_HYPMA|nr:hypothetical protein Hypma_012766 [Hypsizygus marmoreus]